MVREHARHGRGVADVGLHENDAVVLERFLEVEQAACVGQLVDDDDAIRGAGQRVVDQVRADEPGAACDEQSPHAIYNSQL